MQTHRQTITLVAGVRLATAGILVAASNSPTGQAMTGNATVAPTVAVRLPLAIKPRGPAPTAASVPHPVCNLSTDKATDGEICYEVFEVGIGRKCFAPGLHHYGEFPPWPPR